MIPDKRFSGLDKSFWACVRSLSQHLGYTVYRKDVVKVPTIPEMRAAFDALGLDPNAISSKNGVSTELADLLHSYFVYRANVLNKEVKLHLQNKKEARELFYEVRQTFKSDPGCPLPRNKQKDDKKDYAFLTCIVNMLIEKNRREHDCDYDPNRLTTITKDRAPLRTLARRVDGAFPGSVNPVAIWEIKEYYYTTTFGSRVADGVYESLLDGLELEELRESHEVDIKHYLIVDAYDTWWKKGKAYLCRMVDMLNMGYVDEILFGREVIERIPILVKSWIDLVEANKLRGDADPAAATYGSGG